MHKLIDYVCEELDELEKKAAKSDSLSSSDIEYLDKLAHIKKNLLKGEMLYDEIEDDEYSGAMRGGMNYQRGGGQVGGSYRGGSYARGNGRGRGRNARRDSMGRYSSEYGYSRDGEDLAEKLRDLMADAPDEMTRREIEHLVEKVEHM